MHFFHSLFLGRNPISYQDVHKQKAWYWFKILLKLKNLISIISFLFFLTGISWNDVNANVHKRNPHWGKKQQEILVTVNKKWEPEMWSFADVSLLLGKTFSGEQSWLHLSLSLSLSLFKYCPSQQWYLWSSVDEQYLLWSIVLIQVVLLCGVSIWTFRVNFHSSSVTYPWCISPLVNIMLLNKEYAKTSVCYI